MFLNRIGQLDRYSHQAQSNKQGNHFSKVSKSSRKIILNLRCKWSGATNQKLWGGSSNRNYMDLHRRGKKNCIVRALTTSSYFFKQKQSVNYTIFFSFARCWLFFFIGQKFGRQTFSHKKVFDPNCSNLLHAKRKKGWVYIFVLDRWKVNLSSIFWNEHNLKAEQILSKNKLEDSTQTGTTWSNQIGVGQGESK